MATIYRRKDSKKLWMRRKVSGRWVSERTEWRIGDRAGEKKAKELAAKLTLEEMSQKTRSNSGNFSEWVDSWFLEKFGASKTNTYLIYTSQWSWISRWMEERGHRHPLDITRESLSDYREWRKPRPGVRRKGASINTILPEIRTLGRVLKEAKLRGYCTEIVTRELGWKTEDRREFEPWTDEEIHRALEQSAGLTKNKQWIRAALILGTYQASRVGQIEAPLSAFDFTQRMIFWPRSVMKGKKRDWVQPMDPRIIPLLKPLVESRRRERKTTLAERPMLGALHVRRWLDSPKLKIPKVLHGLRATWITKAALSGIPEAVAMAYVHHAGPEVHRIYQRVKPVQTAEFLKQISFGE